MSPCIAHTDTHAHLSLVAKRLGEDALLRILKDYGASPDALLVDIGTEAGDWEERRRLWQSCPAVLGTAGIWPGRKAMADPAGSVRLLVEDMHRGLAEGRLRAVGECGLDYFHNEGPPQAQKALFQAQIECALEFHLPLVVHSRDAFADTLAMVKGPASSVPVIIHCFGYGPGEAEAFLSAGCFVSFAGNLTYPSATALRDACRLVPTDRLLLETDAPYLNPLPHRGKPSSPLDIVRTYEYAAGLRGESAQDLRVSVAQNACRIFGTSPRTRPKD